MTPHAPAHSLLEEQPEDICTPLNPCVDVPGGAPVSTGILPLLGATFSFSADILPQTHSSLLLVTCFPAVPDHIPTGLKYVFYSAQFIVGP